MNTLTAIDLSIVVPAYNEEESILALYEALKSTLDGIELASWNVCFVDDGSTDSTWERISRLCREHPAKAQGVKLRRNFGKAEAIQAGFENTSGNIVVTMDADLQDDPAALPDMLAAVQQGCDLVCGWKRKRHDPPTKVIPSRIFNALTRTLSGLKLHDFNCGFKAYRREVVDNIRLYGELHRFTPVLANAEGFRVSEMEVPHNPRRYGRSKYGWTRFLKGFVDLLTVTILTRFLQSPGHLIGGLGTLSALIGGGILAWLSIGKLFLEQAIGARPLFFLGILLVLVGLQMVSVGLVAELIIRHSQNTGSRHIVQTLNLNTHQSRNHGRQSGK